MYHPFEKGDYAVGHWEYQIAVWNYQVDYSFLPSVDTHKNNYLNFVTLNKSYYYISVEKRNFPCISFVKIKLFSIITSLLLLLPSAVVVSFNIFELIDKATHIRL